MSAPSASITRVQLRELVLRQRLRREQVERPRVRVLQDPVEDRQVVAERLARGRGRHDDDVAAGLDELVGLALVGVEAREAPRRQRLAQLRVELLGEVHDLRGLGREVAQRREHRLAAERLLDLEALEHREQRRVATGARRRGPGGGRDQLLAQRRHTLLAPPPVTSRRGRSRCCRMMQDRVVRAGPECGERPGLCCFTSRRSDAPQDSHAEGGPDPRVRHRRGSGPGRPREDAGAGREGAALPDQRL